MVMGWRARRRERTLATMRLLASISLLLSASLLFACTTDDAASDATTGATTTTTTTTTAAGGAGGATGTGGAGTGGATSAGGGGAGQGGAGQGGAGGATGQGGAAPSSAFEYGVWHDIGGATVDLAGAWAHDGKMVLDSGDCPFTYFEAPSEDQLDVSWDAAQKLLVVHPNVNATAVGFQIHDPGGPTQTITVDGITCKNLDGSIQYSLTGGSLSTDDVVLEAFDPAAHSLKITFVLDGKGANVSSIHVAGFIEAHAK
jgi:hypothetical protein